MEGYRFQQIFYLVIPLLTGIEFFRSARFVRNSTGKESSRTVAMDACGYIFAAFVPALFVFTIFCIEYHRLPMFMQVLHRFDRYGVMFLFLGSWWQIFLITALRARRMPQTGAAMFRSVWAPYLGLGLFISALILWAAPFYLMWVSIFWFVASFGLFALLGTGANRVCRVFLVLAILVFAAENIFFIILDAIV